MLGLRYASTTCLAHVLSVMLILSLVWGMCGEYLMATGGCLQWGQLGILNNLGASISVGECLLKFYFVTVAPMFPTQDYHLVIT